MLLEYVVLDGPSLMEIIYSEGDHAEIQPSDEELDHHHVIEVLENDCDVDDDTNENIDYIVSSESDHDFHRSQESPNGDLKEINENENQLDSTTFEERTALQSQPRKDIVSYQRFGRLNTKILAHPSFKCHLCGFSCCYKETLLNHFNISHPQ